MDYKQHVYLRKRIEQCMAQSEIIDISIPLDEKTPVWPGDPQIKIETTGSRDDGFDYHVSRFTLPSHAGTHLDAPFHFISSGQKLNEIPVSRFVTKALIAEYSQPEHISGEFIRSLDLLETESVLFKTSNSRLYREKKSRFYQDFIALTTSAAEQLIQSNITLVGIDYFSIEPFENENHIVHKTLLKNDILILEGINLDLIEPGIYQLICLPIKIDTPDGAPVRALLSKTVY
jgi:arylformamidase